MARAVQGQAIQARKLDRDAGLGELARGPVQVRRRRLLKLLRLLLLLLERRGDCDSRPAGRWARERRSVRRERERRAGTGVATALCCCSRAAAAGLGGGLLLLLPRVQDGVEGAADDSLSRLAAVEGVGDERQRSAAVVPEEARPGALRVGTRRKRSPRHHWQRARQARGEHVVEEVHLQVRGGEGWGEGGRHA